jgi:hypothetical protein
MFRKRTIFSAAEHTLEAEEEESIYSEEQSGSEAADDF